jgi:hypothetical protein
MSGCKISTSMTGPSPVDKLEQPDFARQWDRPG